MKSATDTLKQQREIAIFWDYENVPLPSWCNTTVAAKAIVDAVSQYGRIVDRRLYYDFDKMNRYRPRDCSSLDSSGFDLVNTPTRNAKETLDKKLIADVLTFAWDSAVRNDHCKPCVVLLTGDGDYAYTLNKLRDRGIMTIVMVGKDFTVASILVDTADVALSLEDDVLRGRETPGGTTPTKTFTKRITTMASTSSSDESSFVQILCRYIEEACATSEDGWADYGQVSCKLQQKIRIQTTGGSSEDIKEKARAVRQDAKTNGLIEIGRRNLDESFDGKREIVTSNNNRLNLSNEVYVRLIPRSQHPTETVVLLCRYVQEACLSSEDGWGDYGQISMKLQQTTRSWTPDASFDVIKQRIRAAREEAEKETLIQIGRRNVGKTINGKREIVPFGTNGRFVNLSPEKYVKLLPKGELLVQNEATGFQKAPKSPLKSATSSSRHGSAVFMRGLPKDTTVGKLVGVLEETYHVTVRRALLEIPLNPNASTINGHVEFFDSKDATMILQQANRAAGGQGLSCGGRYVGVTPNTRTSVLNTKGNEIMYYESEELSTSPSVASPITVDGEMVEVDTSKFDASTFCDSVSLASQKGIQQTPSDGWINSGSVGAAFRSLLSQEYLGTASKEEINSRFRKARNNAIQSGLAEIGRRRLKSMSGDPTFVAVPLFDNSSRFSFNLSPEQYFRLLPAGQELVVERQPKIQSGASPKASQDIEQEKHANTCVFLNNLPLSTKASHLANFLSTTLACSVHRIELENKLWKGTAAVAAHVEFDDAGGADELVRKARTCITGGLVYRSRTIHAVPDRLTPDLIKNNKSINPDLSFTGDQGSSSYAPDSDNSETLHTGMIFNANEAKANSSPFALDADQADPDMSFDPDTGSAEKNTTTATIGTEFSADEQEALETELLIDTNHVMNQISTSLQKDSFEDLLWL